MKGTARRFLLAGALTLLKTAMNAHCALFLVHVPCDKRDIVISSCFFTRFASFNPNSCVKGPEA